MKAQSIGSVSGMSLRIEHCRPDECEYECITACEKIHGHNAPLRFSKQGIAPIIHESDCTQCLACVRACPFGAIKSIHLDEGKKPKPHKKDSLQAPILEKPYEVADYYKRFSEADYIFARVHNDPDFDHYGKNEWFGAEAMIAKDLEGYTEYEHKLAAASWKLYDSRQRVDNPIDSTNTVVSDTKKLVETDTESLTEILKRAARFLGADLVGVTKLDRRWLYTENRRREPHNIPESISYAIVMAIEMDYDAIGTSPAFMSASATGLGYSKMAFAEIELSEFIRSLGYQAIPCGNDIAASVPLAIDAGLGQFGRHGILITKKFGPRVRIAKVLTDIPLLQDTPDTKYCESVIRFCETCEKCAHHCPSKSIPTGKARTWDGETRSNNPGVRKWYVNPETCYGFWVENGSDCSNCIRSCPYNKRDGLLHRLVLWTVRHFPWMNRVIVKMDDLLGYGKQKSSNSAWRKFR
ncbi:MAG: reductive dehalogenase [Candidatus Thorarchaeota archaeon]|jgi:reductive dehalogenase